MWYIVTELKNVCTYHGIAWKNWEIQGFLATCLHLNYYFAANFWQVFKDETVVLFYTPVTGQSIVKVLSLAVLPVS